MPFDAPPATDLAVVELRQYTLKPGARDTLLTLFDTFFVDGQALAGIRVLGAYRDAKDPDRFVFLRGFRDMPARAEALAAFYGGPIWKAHRDAANATMVDVQDVLLLRPLRPAVAIPPNHWLLATVWLLKEPVGEAFERRFREEIAPVLGAAGVPAVAAWRTEYAANNYPRLPIREGENAFVFVSAFADRAAVEKAQAALASSSAWRELQASIAPTFAKPAQVLVLDPSGSAARRDGRRDFDFLVGEWRVANRRLMERGVGSSRWDEFMATSAMRQHLGGNVNVDEIHFPTKGWSGFTLRSWDIERREWNIWWINSRDGKMQSPVTGNWHNGTGTFIGVDEDGGRPIDVVFTWKSMGDGKATWEQAFSYDRGRTWETNWTMTLERTSGQGAAYTGSR